MSNKIRLSGYLVLVKLGFLGSFLTQARRKNLTIHFMYNQHTLFKGSFC